MTGLELVTALRAQGVKVPTLLISGRLTPAVTRQASVAGIPVVEKPFLGNGLIDPFAPPSARSRAEARRRLCNGHVINPLLRLRSLRYAPPLRMPSDRLRTVAKI